MVFARPPGQPTSPSANLLCFKKLSFDFNIYGVFLPQYKIPLFFIFLDVKGAEEQLYMGVQLFKAFSFPFRLAVADTEQDDDR